MTQPFVDGLNQLMDGGGISNNELARRVDVDGAQVGRWRKGLGLPRPENIVRIAAVFQVDYEWLMGLAYPESRPRSTGPIDPALSAFLSEVEAGYHALDEAERPIAVRGTLALFGVPPVNRGSTNLSQAVSKRIRRQLAARNETDSHEPEHGPEGGITPRYARPNSSRHIAPNHTEYGVTAGSRHALMVR